MTKQILEHADGMFSEPQKKITYCYDTWRSMYDQLRQNLKEITFHKGIPDEDQFNEWGTIHSHKLLILDDCLLEASNSEYLMNMFCDHQNLTGFFNTECVPEG